MSLSKFSSGLLILLVLAIAILSSLSDPGYAPSDRTAENETSPASLPPFEDLLPDGTRADKELALQVMSGADVVEMTMEQYLIGALTGEMPASFEPEALKAQAIAARTNILYAMYVRANARHPEAVVCTDSRCCMAYMRDEQLRERWRGDYVRNISKIICAVVETDGVYMSFEDEPILAVFHSSSAGKTEASGNVWLTDLPYLSIVDSPETEEQVPGYISTVTISRDEFTDRVRQSYPDAVFDEENDDLWITNITLNESGRVSELILGGVTIRGAAMRSMFGLRSTAVSIEQVDDEIVFTVTGYGHGVGMSQYGANVMASGGADHTDILSHYYTGVAFDSTTALSGDILPPQQTL